MFTPRSPFSLEHVRPKLTLYQWNMKKPLLKVSPLPKIIRLTPESWHPFRRCVVPYIIAECLQFNLIYITLLCYEKTLFIWNSNIACLLLTHEIFFFGNCMITVFNMSFHMHTPKCFWIQIIFKKQRLRNLQNRTFSWGLKCLKHFQAPLSRRCHSRCQMSL